MTIKYEVKKGKDIHNKNKDVWRIYNIKTSNFEHLFDNEKAANNWLAKANGETIVNPAIVNPVSGKKEEVKITDKKLKGDIV